MYFIRTLATGLALLPVMAFAAIADPTDAAASVGSARYESAFNGYIASQDQAAGAWRESNEEMGRVGGHAGHVKSPANTLSPTVPPIMPKGTIDRDAHQKLERAP